MIQCLENVISRGGGPQPVFTFKSHESLGYNTQSDFLCSDSLVVSGSASNKAYIYSVDTGGLVGLVQTQLNPVTLVSACPSVSAFAFNVCGMHNSSLELADVGLSESKPADREMPALEVSREDITKEKVMKLLVKHARLMVRLAQENDLVVTSEGFGMRLEILMVSTDPEMIQFRRELLESFSQQLVVTDAEVEIRQRLDKRKLKDAWTECFTCNICQNQLDLILTGILPTPQTEAELLNPLAFEVNPKSELSNA